MPNDKPLKKRTRNKEHKIEMLKTATKEQLIEGGFHSLSIQKILSLTSVTKGALFHHFPSKDHLIAAAFEELLEDLLQNLHDLSRDLRAGKISRNQFVREMTNNVSQERFHGCMEIGLGMRTEFALAELIEGAVNNWRRGFHEFFKTTFDLPGRSEDEIDVHWSIAANALRGHAFSTTFGITPAAQAKHIKGFSEIFLDGATIRPADPTGNVTVLNTKTTGRET